MKSFTWLRSTEIELEQQKFRGKLAGKSYQYSKHLDGLRRTRIIIFVMSLLVFFPVMNVYFIVGQFPLGLFIERVIFSIVLILAGLLFNRLRIPALILAMIPIMIIIGSYLLVPGQFDVRIIGFMGAILVFVGLGIYHHLKSQKIGKELEKNTLEAHLIDAK